MGKIQKQWLLLYIAFPSAMAIYNGVRGSLWAPDLNMFKSTILYLACAVPLYICAALFSHGLLRIADRFWLHPLVALICGGAAALILSYFYIVFLVEASAAFFPGIEVTLAAEGSDLVGGLKDYLIGQSGVLFMCLWLLLHFIHEQVTKNVSFFKGLVSEQPTVQTASETVPAPSGLLARLSPEIGRNVLALEAQEHYVRVYTDLGQDLVLYRFGDAMSELQARYPGRRVHRSYWVADDAVTDIRRSGKSYKLTLRNGLYVPVSLSHRGSIERLSLSNGLEAEAAK